MMYIYIILKLELNLNLNLNYSNHEFLNKQCGKTNSHMSLVMAIHNYPFWKRAIPSRTALIYSHV